ncbi:MAG TPA: ADP-heptose--LPS heptosyltransferase [Holosporales bacterium]|nr:ADP-heptose--LPS heptosyltransferase [Holosporales bacterium]
MSYSNILVYVGGELVGDGLIKLPFVYALRDAYPQAKITWCYGEFESVYKNVLAPLVSSKIDEIVALKELKQHNFDLVIDTQSEWLTTLKLKFSLKHKAFFSSTLRYLFSDFKPPKGYDIPRRLIDKMLGFLHIIGVTPHENYKLELSEEWRAKACELLPEGKCYIGLAVGAGYRSKCWPRDSYQELSKLLIKEGYQPVVILGPQEQDWVQEFKENLAEALYPLQDARVAKQSPLLTIALAERLTAAVSNDCGIGHMFAAANTPLVTLFGPTTAEKFAPKISRAQILRAQDFGGESMEAIPLESVQKALKEVLLS